MVNASFRARRAALRLQTAADSSVRVAMAPIRFALASACSCRLLPARAFVADAAASSVASGQCLLLWLCPRTTEQEVLDHVGLGRAARRLGGSRSGGRGGHGVRG